MFPRAISPREVRRRLETDEGLLLIDVRPESEPSLPKAEESIRMPELEIPHRFPELAGMEPIVFLCRRGDRSRELAIWFWTMGLSRVTFVEGGAERWLWEFETSERAECRISRHEDSRHRRGNGRG